MGKDNASARAGGACSDCRAAAYLMQRYAIFVANQGQVWLKFVANQGQIRGIAFSPQLQHSCYYQSLVLPLEVIG